MSNEEGFKDVIKVLAGITPYNLPSITHSIIYGGEISTSSSTSSSSNNSNSKYWREPMSTIRRLHEETMFRDDPNESSRYDSDDDVNTDDYAYGDDNDYSDEF
jgi:hypothetical protein